MTRANRNVGMVQVVPLFFNLITTGRHKGGGAERRLIDTLREGQQWVVTFELSSRNFL